MKRLLTALLLALTTANAWAAGLIVDTAFVSEAVQRGAIVWDVRSADQYRMGHIPGAVNIGHAGAVLRNPNTEDFIPVAQIERILGAAGIDPAKEIVVYASRGDPFAYFGLYTIQYFGGKRVHVYHDGIDGWREAGRSVSSAGYRRAPVSLKLATNPAVAAMTSEVIAALKRRDVQLLDVRTVGEFTGDDIRAIRGGHIPGAVNIPYEQNWMDPDTPLKVARRQAKDNAGMTLKPVNELKRLYSGLDPGKETIVYCQSGVRAAQTATVLSQLGFRNVKVYDASWLGYAGVLSAPANNEVFFNVGALQGRLSALQSRIDQLERELGEARARK
ncbi:MAG: sulfurtransferase [Betaproteobacteria bacterium]|nr:sulfurtransferase [Betaproteobacteria bacterium]